MLNGTWVYQSAKGEFRVQPAGERPGTWAVLLDRQYLCLGLPSPEVAAETAARLAATAVIPWDVPGSLAKWHHVV